MSRFKKGQTIYRASEWAIKQHDDRLGTRHYVYVVLTAVVDACGKKKVTFFDNTVDTACRSCNADHPDLCATPEEAMARIHNIIEYRKSSNASLEGKYPYPNYTGLINSTYQIVETIYEDNSVGYTQLRNDLSYLQKQSYNILSPSFILSYPALCDYYPSIAE